MYFLALCGPFGKKPRGRTLYPTIGQARLELAILNLTTREDVIYSIEDADTVIGRQIMRKAGI